MNVPPLCIIQARYNSTRLPGKMLLRLGGETLIERAWRLACEAFGLEHCVVAIVAHDAKGPLGVELRRIDARVFAWDWEESDVLGRFHACAHAHRWHPDSVIVRYTPDDPFKDTLQMQLVALGWRLPVELGAEAFTLAMLDQAHATATGEAREHITHAIFPTPTQKAPPGCWTIDSQADYEAACARLAGA